MITALVMVIPLTSITTFLGRIEGTDEPVSTFERQMISLSLNDKVKDGNFPLNEKAQL